MSRSPRLTVLSQPFMGRTFDLKKQRYAVGRRGENDIVLDHGSVSGRHCELVRNSDGSYCIVDEGSSTNGTRIGGKLVTRYALNDGDIVQIGGVECLYDTNTQTPSAISSVNSQIRVATNPIIPNQDISLAPEWLRSDEEFAALGFRVLLAVLAFVVLVLGLVLSIHIF